MRIYNLYYDIDLMDFIKCRIKPDYKIEKGVILEDNHNIIGFILYHNELKGEEYIVHIDYIFADNDSTKDILLVKFYNKMKHLNYNLILQSVETNTEIINKYIDLKYKIFCFNKDYSECTLYKEIYNKKINL